MRKYKVTPVDRSLESKLVKKIDGKTKPIGSLGVLETIAVQVGLIQNTLSPILQQPHLIVYAGDHGIAKEGVSAFPHDVTWQMVMNFSKGGAAVNVFSRQNNISLKIVDAGVNYDFPKDLPGLIRNKAAKSTASFLREEAMTVKHAQRCIDTSANIIQSIHKEGCNIIGFGEMGIGNTSSASALMSVICNIAIEKCIGSGTGLDADGVRHKLTVLTKAIARHGKPDTFLKTLAAYGGYEIAQIVGAILQAAELKMTILIDGFISTVAYLVAEKIEPHVKDYCIFCHQSSERGHALLLDYLKVKPLLNLEMRLGEGTGVAVAFPIIQCAVSFLNEMASFESATVANKL